MNRQHPDTVRDVAPVEGRLVRVLLADDHALVRRTLLEIIAQCAGVSIVGEARNGEEAVTRTAALHPCVVVLDVNMPRLDGIQATRAIKRLDPSIAVIGLSADPHTLKVQAMKAAGAFDLLRKEESVEKLCPSILDAAARQSLMPSDDLAA